MPKRNSKGDMLRRIAFFCTFVPIRMAVVQEPFLWFVVLLPVNKKKNKEREI